MRSERRKLAFVLAGSGHGPLIVNRLDFRAVDPTKFVGVGMSILEHHVFHPEEVGLALRLLEQRRRHHGDGVFAIDCGANIGAHTIEWAQHMTGWGSVLAFEPQERIYYALAGNIALNNCFNARAVLAAVTATHGRLRIPRVDHLQPGNFGGLELRQSENNEPIGQPVDYTGDQLDEVDTVALDSLNLPRVDFVKIDVEGMETEVLSGAANLLVTHRPVLLIEWIKSDKQELVGSLQKQGYTVFEVGMNLLAVHASDPTLADIKVG